MYANDVDISQKRWEEKPVVFKRQVQAQMIDLLLEMERDPYMHGTTFSALTR